jgi:hypothetical protein
MITPKETLTVEWLQSYNMYRVWNTWNENWYESWESFVKCVNEYKLLEIYNFVSYNEETQRKLEELK